MTIHYLEIVCANPAAQSAALEKILGFQFRGPIAELGDAYVAENADGGRIGVRASMHETEEPVVRPYFLSDDLERDLKHLEALGAQIAHPPMEIPGRGAFAIYILNGVQFGLWRL